MYAITKNICMLPLSAIRENRRILFSDPGTPSPLLSFPCKPIKAMRYLGRRVPRAAVCTCWVLASHWRKGLAKLAAPPPQPPPPHHTSHTSVFSQLNSVYFFFIHDVSRDLYFSNNSTDFKLMGEGEPAWRVFALSCRRHIVGKTRGGNSNISNLYYFIFYIRTQKTREGSKRENSAIVMRHQRSNCRTKGPSTTR